MNTLHLNNTETSYPVAVAVHYSFDNGQLYLFETKDAAIAFISKTKEEEIKADLDLGYEYRETNDFYLCGSC